MEEELEQCQLLSYCSEREAYPISESKMKRKFGGRKLAFQSIELPESIIEVHNCFPLKDSVEKKFVIETDNNTYVMDEKFTFELSNSQSTKAYFDVFDNGVKKRSYFGFEGLKMQLKWGTDTLRDWKMTIRCVIHRDDQKIHESYVRTKQPANLDLPEKLTWDRYLILWGMIKGKEGCWMPALIDIDLEALSALESGAVYKPTILEFPGKELDCYYGLSYTIFRLNGEKKHLLYYDQVYSLDGRLYSPFAQRVNEIKRTEYCDGLFVTGGSHNYRKGSFAYYVFDLNFAITASLTVPSNAIKYGLTQLLLWKKARHLCILGYHDSCLDFLILNGNSLMLVDQNWFGHSEEVNWMCWYTEEKEVIFGAGKRILEIAKV